MTASTPLSIEDIPKSHVFTSKLTPDPNFKTPEESASAPRSALGPRMVKGAHFTYVVPLPPTGTPELLAVSPLALKTLGLSQSTTTTETFLNLTSGAPTGFESSHYPWAQCYGGYQFGQWAGQLGDGRAISLFEATNPDTGKRYEIQLKGAGMTPYSRFADGKAVLRSSIREFVVSEYLHSLGIPTTRALALTLRTGEQAVRERVEPSAVVTRFAESWIRCGSFDLFRYRADRVRMRQLADYVREEVLKSEEVEGENRYWSMYKDIVRRNAETVAKWQVYGFMNGVLNTDNTSIMGLSLDFGPFAFMDVFDPDYTPNHDDHALRYSYRNQPTIIWWNLVRLGEALAELFCAENPDSPEFMKEGLSNAPEEAINAWVAKAEKLIGEAGDLYKTQFMAEYSKTWAGRLGIKNDMGEKDVDELYAPMLDVLKAGGLDFHHFFRKLAGMPLLSASAKELADELFDTTSCSKDAAEDLEKWIAKYQARLREEGWKGEAEELKKELLAKNPKFVPRGWVLEEVIERVEKKGEREILKEIMRMVENPFAEKWEGVTEEWAEKICGDVPGRKVSMQCSCSS